MTPEDLKAFMSGNMTESALNAIKVMKAVDVKADVNARVKKESDIENELDRLEEKFENITYKPSLVEQKASNIPLDAIQALVKGGKTNIEDAREVLSKNKINESLNTVKKSVNTKVDKKIDTYFDEKKNNVNMEEVKGLIKETCYDFILMEALSDNRIEKIVNKVLKENFKTYLKEALSEIKNKK